MIAWQKLVRMPDAELGRIDIATVNLACAENLPGGKKIDWDLSKRKLDAWTSSCQKYTNVLMPYFGTAKCDYPESEAKYRIQGMVSHLQRDLAVRYHPERSSDVAVFQPEDSFLHGILQGEGGTCASMPVLYTSIGRRLGYPITLRKTRCHGYCRWDGGPNGENFNIEGSGYGISFFDDAYYKTEKYAMPDETIRLCGFLKSLAPREELAMFIADGGECWFEEKKYREAFISFAWAHELNSNVGNYEFLLRQLINRWDQAIQSRLPSKLFPKLDIGIPACPFRNLPKDIEKKYIGLFLTEELLNNATYEALWWDKMRKYSWERPTGLPQVMRVNFQWPSF